jgi:hypothetical protein
VFGVEVKKSENPAEGDVRDTAELGWKWTAQAREHEKYSNRSEDGKPGHLIPGLLTHVIMTAGAAEGSTGVLRRRMAAEMRVMIRPTGRGSMTV